MSNNCYWSNEIKEYLNNLEKILKRNKGGTYDLLPCLYLRCESGAGVTTFARECASIVEQYLETSKNSFLELVFPAHFESERDVKRFFESPRLQAVRGNRFYGTFLVSLCECDDKTFESSVFLKLLSFIHENLGNIHFIFIAPNKDEQLLRKLRSVAEITELTLKKPDEVTGIAYIIDRLNSFDVNVPYECHEYIAISLIPAVLRNENCGFNTLNLIVNSIVREVFISGSKTVSTEQMEKIVADFQKNNASHVERKIGFGV